MSDPFEQAGEVPDGVLRLAEAYVFASREPVRARALQPLLPEGQNAYLVLEALERRCAGRGVVLAETDGGWGFRTALDLADQLRPAFTRPRALPRAAMEALAIIGLYQPVTRADIEGVRGVSLGQSALDALLEAGLVRPAGRKDGPGRPTLWATTPRFLAEFGLRSLRDLPGAGLPLPPEAGGRAAAAGTGSDAGNAP